LLAAALLNKASATITTDSTTMRTGDNNETKVDLALVLERVATEAVRLFGSGQVASYLPALKAVQPQQFGMALVTVDGRQAEVGQSLQPFSIQSISKLFTLSMVLKQHEVELWQRCGREPSGNRFNSLVQLEHEAGVPRNPFINAGALVVADILTRHSANARAAILDVLKRLSGNERIGFDHHVARSEAEHGDRNAALAHFMKSFGVIQGDVKAVLDTYFHQCAITMSCLDLARAGLFLANRGVSPLLKAPMLTPLQSRRINALMLTCGLYDSVGEFAFDVGLPAKSGVGGGILAIVPGKMAIAAWAPELDASGNSVVAAEALRLFVEYTGLGVF
jgi:glutaminase